jgi:hypothetical protein
MFQTKHIAVEKETALSTETTFAYNQDIIATTFHFRIPVFESQLHNLTSEEVARDSIQTASFQLQALEETILSEVEIGYNMIISDFWRPLGLQISQLQ